MESQYTIVQVAEALGLHRMTVTQLILDGYIASTKNDRGHRIVSHEELEKVKALRTEHKRKWMNYVTPVKPETSRVNTPQNPLTR